MTDLSPRTGPDTDTPAAKSKKRWMSIVVLCVVLVAGGVIVTQFLRSAVDYYCNVDEIGQRRAERAEGIVELQKKVSEILGIELQKSAESD